MSNTSHHYLVEYSATYDKSVSIGKTTKSILQPPDLGLQKTIACHNGAAKAEQAVLDPSFEANVNRTAQPA